MDTSWCWSESILQLAVSLKSLVYTRQPDPLTLPHRYPAVHIVSIVAELLAFPMGVALAHILPIMSVDIPYFGKWRINPDRHFNIKEHVSRSGLA